MKRLLIISNNVLSNTNNNGKTILSFIDGVEDLDVAQLYLSGEKPRISKYRYFQICDRDIIKGIFNKRKRGRIIIPYNGTSNSDDFSIRNTVGRNDFTLIVRDLLWLKKWKSIHLIEWLDAFNPEAILFVAGDSLFAYSICEYIQERFNSKLSVYVTDDYIMPRSNENILHWLRRKAILKCFKHTLVISSTFFTISEIMRRTYKRILGKDSYIIMNMVEDLFDDTYIKKEPEIILTYTGSFYYKRAEVLGLIAKAILEYNMQTEYIKAKLIMYSNREPSKEIVEQIIIPGASEYGGSLNKEELRERLNTSDILVFVESFDSDQIEKVKYSLSTKVPEYMSIGKPILAVGPKGVGSMDYLSDVALCINDVNSIISDISNFLGDIELQHIFEKKTREKYLKNHDKMKNQRAFIQHVFGTNGAKQ